MQNVCANFLSGLYAVFSVKWEFHLFLEKKNTVLGSLVEKWTEGFRLFCIKNGTILQG